MRLFYIFLVHCRVA